MSDLDMFLQEQLADPQFAKEWEAVSLEDQIKRLIIEARIQSNLTQRELAEKSGIRQSNISRIERGISMPTLDTLNSIAQGFGKHLKIEFV